MKIKSRNLLATVIIVNYNNAKFITPCLKSIFNQKYKKIEIIVVDDQSTDNSIKILKKFQKKIKIIKTDKKIGKGSFNQMYGYLCGLKRSNGHVVFFLDSDDYFKKDKIYKIMNDFKKNKELKIIYDLPIKKFLNKEVKIYNKNISSKNYWPYIPPTSCIAIKKKELIKIYNLVNFKLFPDIWLDFRIGIVAKYIWNDLNIKNEHLTYYRQSEQNISSNFVFLSSNWWKRRKEAHSYMKYFLLKNKIKYKKNYDYFITSIVNFFIL
tara:strand:+ start:382 stop:1179 length:798 start_codon:yes stop_codon:yes gene_type:complete